MDFDDIKARAKALLVSRNRAYSRTFYNGNIDAHLVLKDLAKFCRADKSTFDGDPRVHALLEGRKEVWNRIQSYIQLTPDELWELYRKD